MTSLWQDCLLHVTFPSPGVEALNTVPIRLPNCITATTWDLYLQITDGQVTPNFRRGPLLASTQS